MSNDYNPLGNWRDNLDFLDKVNQLQNTRDVAKIRELLEREVNKGNAKAKAIAELVRKHTCHCVPKNNREEQYDKQKNRCLQCQGAGMVTGRELRYKCKDWQSIKPLMQPCRMCDGGSPYHHGTCSTCNGTGKENVYGERDGERIRRLTNVNPYDGQTPDRIVYMCPQCNGTGRYCKFCENTGILMRDEYERELKRIEERYR